MKKYIYLKNSWKKCLEKKIHWYQLIKYLIRQISGAKYFFTLNYFRNNDTNLLLNLINIKPLTDKTNLQPSMHLVKAQEDHGSNTIITETTATAKHCNDNDSDDANISDITCFSSTISDTFLSYVISMPEANETSSDEISMSSQLPSKYEQSQ